MTAEAQARYAARQKALDPEAWYARRRAINTRNAAKHLGQRAANLRVQRAVKRGELTRPDACETCGKPCKPEGAHTDYSRPLDVMWLCRKCHAVMDLGKAS